MAPSGHAPTGPVRPADMPDVTDMRLQMPSVALTFAAPATACADVRVAPESELRALLLPAHLVASDSVTSVRVDKSDATSGCKLRVEVYRASTTANASDVFGIAAAVDAKIALATPRTTQLRGADTNPLALERMSLQVARAHYDVVLRGNAHDDAKPVGSALSLHGRKCSPHLQNAALVQRHVLPLDVDAGALAIETSNDFAASMGHELDCLVMLEVTARAPLLRADAAADDALSYLRAFDAKLDETFDPNAHTRVFANIELHAASSSSVAMAALPSVDSALVESASLPSNAPTKAMTMSVLGGLVALVAMLVAVALAKSRHEKKCEERYRNASKAAQIRRVSIRMASPARARNAFGEEDEETKDDDDDSDAYGEADGLL